MPISPLLAYLIVDSREYGKIKEFVEKLTSGGANEQIILDLIENPMLGGETNAEKREKEKARATRAAGNRSAIVRADAGSLTLSSSEGLPRPASPVTPPAVSSVTSPHVGAWGGAGALAASGAQVEAEAAKAEADAKDPKEAAAKAKAGGAPVDPAGGAPVDPAGGAPVDPAGGAPVDPAGGAPVDPAGAAGEESKENLGEPVDPTKLLGKIAEKLTPEDIMNVFIVILTLLNKNR